MKITADSSSGGVELLVHNISHSDMVVTLQEVPANGTSTATPEPPTFLARPMFNSFNPISQAIVAHLDSFAAERLQPKVVSCMSKYRVQYPTGLDLTSDGTDDLILRPGQATVANGEAIDAGDSSSSSSSSSGGGGGGGGGDGSPSAPASAASAWGHFHVKGRKDPQGAVPQPLDPQHSAVRVVGVYLPLLAVVIPEWMRAIKRRGLQQPKSTPAPRKVLVIVSGAGQPRNDKANPADNSTEGTGEIIERFVRLVHPDIEVVHIPSAYGIFRYDDNVRFVKEQVLPVIEAKRAQVVASHGDQWSNNLKLTVCLADGAPARISALNAAMRSYRPDYLHVWRTKTFWDTTMLSEEDVESHTFKKLEMRPATHRSQLTYAEDKGLVEEMVRYKRQFEAVRDADSHELGTFWLRKTGKAVLAVLLTRRPDGTVYYWRGLNVEVSMPTGTLCAERNAIGNALAADQSVHRRDMLAVAVLSVSLAPDGALIRDAGSDDIALNPLDPCGACMEWLKKISEVNPDFKVLTFTSTSCEKVFVTPIGDYG